MKNASIAAGELFRLPVNRSFTGEKSLCGSVLNAAAVSAGKVNPITAVRSRPSISTSKSRMNRSGHR